MRTGEHLRLEDVVSRKAFVAREPLSPGKSFWEVVRELVGGQAVLDS